MSDTSQPDIAAEHHSKDDEGPDNEPKPEDVAETPGSNRVDHDHASDLADEWGKESFPSSDPPAHY